MRHLWTFCFIAVTAGLSMGTVCSGCPWEKCGDDGDGPAGEGEGEGEGEGDGPLGFPLRAPGTETVACDEDPTFCPGGSVEIAHTDHVCTLTVNGLDHVVYVQGNPTAVAVFGFPLFADVTGYVHDRAGGTTVEAPAGYDWGGGHHNDFIDIEVEGTAYRFNHSSYGFGYRACQPPDCVQILDGAGAVVDDGCTSDRTHPEVCALVTSSAALPSLEDTFARCNGDPNG